MQKYFEKLRAIPFKFKVKSLCCPYSLEQHWRHAKWDTWHRLHRRSGIRTWDCFWSLLLSIPPRSEQKKGHLPSACPAGCYWDSSPTVSALLGARSFRKQLQQVCRAAWWRGFQLFSNPSQCRVVLGPRQFLGSYFSQRPLLALEWQQLRLPVRWREGVSALLRENHWLIGHRGWRWTVHWQVWASHNSPRSPNTAHDPACRPG